MIEVENKERAIRTIESFHLLSIVLPIYDDEARAVFRASFKHDIADLIPDLFRHIALVCVKDQNEFFLYLDFIADLIKYIKGEKNNYPLPEGCREDEQTLARERAIKLINSWNVKNNKLIQPSKNLAGETK